MKYIILIFSFLLFFGCAEKKIVLPQYKGLYLIKSNKKIDDDYNLALKLFINNCKTKYAKKIYKDLCTKAQTTKDAKKFFESNFDLYKIVNSNNNDKGILSGYYEASLKCSKTKKPPYIYPVYKTPKDLITVELSSIYPELKKYRLRGRLVKNKLIPYYKRGEKTKLNADVICYTNNKIDLFSHLFYNKV